MGGDPSNMLGFSRFSKMQENINYRYGIFTVNGVPRKWFINVGFSTYTYASQSKWLKTTLVLQGFLPEMCTKHCKAIGPPKSDNLGPHATVHETWRKPSKYCFAHSQNRQNRWEKCNLWCPVSHISFGIELARFLTFLLFFFLSYFLTVFLCFFLFLFFVFSFFLFFLSLSHTAVFVANFLRTMSYVQGVI